MITKNQYLAQFDFDFSSDGRPQYPLYPEIEQAVLNLPESADVYDMAVAAATIIIQNHGNDLIVSIWGHPIGTRSIGVLFQFLNPNDGYSGSNRYGCPSLVRHQIEYQTEDQYPGAIELVNKYDLPNPDEMEQTPSVLTEADLVTFAVIQREFDKMTGRNPLSGFGEEDNQ